MTEVTPTEDVVEVSPLEMIASLEEDLRLARQALRRIQNINPLAIPGGPNNMGFGYKGAIALQHAQVTAQTALVQMTNKQVD